ncbi:MAG: iron-sulfur cluster repair di-iron protein [Phycisphaerae bacterium]|nr:iron-sulfur cluster repair di-iron protein [Phycisphaerae bacterium]
MAEVLSTTATLGLDSPVSQWVVESPVRSRIFEKSGIDYCCGGKATLRQACAKHQLNPDAVVAELLATASDAKERDWSTASLTELADHIESTHHAYLKDELPRLARLIHQTYTVHGLHYRWLADLKATYERFAAEMDAHMFKEEHILFPRIREIDAGNKGAAVSQPVAIMEQEHERAGACLEHLRRLSSGYAVPEEACNTLRAMLDGLRELEANTHIHVHKENSILFPKAVAATGR